MKNEDGKEKGRKNRPFLNWFITNPRPAIRTDGVHLAVPGKPGTRM